MKITFMGTGAADWDISKRKNGEFFRRLSGVLINDDLMIDCSADIVDFAEKNSFKLSDVTSLLITHSHSDHFEPETIEKLLSEKVNIWTEKNTADMVQKSLSGFNIHEIELFKPYQIDKYTVTALPANHISNDISQQPVHYIIQSEDKTIFWGCDGAWFLEKTWYEMRKFSFDYVVLDGTLGNKEGDYRIFEHNNLSMVKEISAAIRECSMLKENGKIIISHMSKYSHDEHEILTDQMNKMGITVAYDGMVI